MLPITLLHAGPAMRVWQLDLDAPPTPQAVAALSDGEWDRARRFVFKRDRQRFIAAHAALRETLSSQVGLPAAMLEFEQGPFGKPSLVEPSALRFNLSHSQGMGLIAVCNDVEIGADIELLRPMSDIDALARNYFSEREREALEALPRELHERAFLTCWTRKEACLKATGMGLSVDTRSFEVGVVPDARELTIHTAEGSTRLALQSIGDVEGALCAVARVLAHREADLVRRLAEPEGEMCR